ncbi:MAG: hypothetical protein U0W40_15475 [Acidimicrobiia bacterium]
MDLSRRDLLSAGGIGAVGAGMALGSGGTGSCFFRELVAQAADVVLGRQRPRRHRARRSS